MNSAFSKKTAKVVILSQSSIHRFMLSDTLRSCGYTQLEILSEGKELLRYLEVETPHWIIMPMATHNDPVSALHVLKIASSVPRLSRLRVSTFIQEDELSALPLAFEHGLMSWHFSTAIKDEAETAIKGLIATFEKANWDSTLVAAEYLRKYLLDQEHYASLLGLEQELCKQYPGNARLLLQLAEAQILTGEIEKGLITLEQVLLLDPDLAPSVDHVRKEHMIEDFLSEPMETLAPSAREQRINALGIDSCVIIDLDTTMHYSLTTILKDFGVPHVHAFADGEKAWNWLKSNPEPGLIIAEWRIPSLPGPLLIQRIRSHQFFQVPIVIASSLIQADEVPLVQEMGVAAVIEKPFQQQTLIRTLVWVLQQQRHPTEQFSLERKIRQNLELKKLGEAARLVQSFTEDSRISEGAKTTMEAEFKFASGEYEKAQDLAVAAIKLNGDNLMLYSLLGKCFLKTGQHELALKCFSKAQAISPGNIERLCSIAEINHELGDFEAERTAIEEAEKVDAGNSAYQTRAAGLALMHGDQKRAKAIMAKLDSVSRLLALMNNRAIALAKRGVFEDAIDLYRRTLEALPEKWSKNHDAVAYNLGLAFARYGELDRCLEELEKVRGAAPALKQKALSLQRRVREAAKKGHALILSSDSQDAGKSAKSTGEAPVSQPDSFFEVRRGDLCCFMIYRAMDLASAKWLAVLAKLPDFHERQPIVREETNFQH